MEEALYKGKDKGVQSEKGESTSRVRKRVKGVQQGCARNVIFGNQDGEVYVAWRGKCVG